MCREDYQSSAKIAWFVYDFVCPPESTKNSPFTAKGSLAIY